MEKQLDINFKPVRPIRTYITRHPKLSDKLNPQGQWPSIGEREKGREGGRNYNSRSVKWKVRWKKATLCQLLDDRREELLIVLICLLSPLTHSLSLFLSSFSAFIFLFLSVSYGPLLNPTFVTRLGFLRKPNQERAPPKRVLSIAWENPNRHTMLIHRCREITL